MIKKLFKNKRFTVWFSVTVSLVVLMVVIGSLLGTVLYDVLKAVLGREIAVYAEGSEPLYVTETTSKQDALNKANELNVRICEEGSVLLKNVGEALPLAPGSKISVFGKNSANIVYGGSGSGGGNENGRISLYDALRADGFVLNDKLISFYNSPASGSGRSDNPDDLDTGADVDLSIGETPYSSYGVDVTNSYKDYNEAALIVLSRIGGEGFDLPRQSVDDSSRHYLELDPNESKLVEEVTKANFKKVIVIINSSAVMELGWVKTNEKIDACLWIGAPGNSGIKALGRILKGDVTPSGRTVDTWAADLLAAPAAANLGSNGEYEGDAYLVPDAEGKVPTDSKGRPAASGYFVEYEESIYVGYRYYETRGFTDGEEWYNNNVVYPFGYGESYTTFTSEIVNKNELNGKTMSATEKFTVEVKVKNTGTKYSGKEVVQIYVTPKYNEGGIEKAHKVLCGFAKTDELAIKANESAETPNEQTLKVEIDPYYFASYDYSGKNSADYKGYILEAGEYTFTLGKNAHDKIDSFTLVLNEDHKFDIDPVTKNPVVNRFDDIDDELDTVLSRADWAGTWPEKPTYESRLKTDDFIKSITTTKHNNPETYDKMPDTEKAVTVTLFQLAHDEEYRSKNKFEQYDDKRWDAILDSLSVKEMGELVNRGAFGTQAITKIDKSATVEADGPAGFTVFMGDPTIYDTCAYASEVIMASTWDVDILKAVGNSIGEEGLWGNQSGDGSPYSGIYAPGANIHRTPFGGRNFEYFSEDSYLSGVMAANEIKGASEKGVYMFMKHFVANEQETHRSLITGLCTWMTEQSLREIYLRPFEIAVKEADANGMMSSFNRLGKKWTGGDYELLTEVLRNEWGFRGTVISDFNTVKYMNTKQMVYAGGDLDLSTLNANRWMNYKADNISDVSVLRKATKNILFTISTSNAMNYRVKYYLLPAWLCVTIAIICAIAAGLAVWGFFVVRATLKAIKAEGADGNTVATDSETSSADGDAEQPE